MTLSDDLARIAARAAAFAAPEERIAGILATEPLGTGRIYLCAYASDRGEHGWLALDEGGAPVASRETVRQAASLAALCEVAEESAGGGDLAELRSRLAELREREEPEGIEEAEQAAAALAEALQGEPRLATTDYLDRLGVASRRLEQALGEATGSPFAAALQHAVGAVEELAVDVERRYKGPLA